MAGDEPVWVNKGYNGRPCHSHCALSPSTMADMDMLAAMGITGFGKASAKRQLDPARFDKTKRTDAKASPPPF